MSDESPDHQLYAQAKSILQRVFEIPAAERGAYLESVCGNHPELRAEVFSLLAAHEQVSRQFLDSPLALQIDGAETGADADDKDLTGQRIGAYRLERLLGRGGMGAVYLASRDDGEFKKHVAIKFIRSSVATPALLKRFKAERQILADIDHPNIARLIDGGTAEGGMPFFIMEYVPGENLTHVLGQGPLPLPRVLALATAVADVLEAVHAKGMVFRDLKPSNIMLTEQSGVKVLDFGIAKITRDESGEHSTSVTESGWIVGSPRYMSPEQATGEAVDARSDVFSFGVVMFEALTGRLPFKGDSRQEYFRSLITAVHEPLPTSIPDGLRLVLERCLKKSPADRYPSGKELAHAMRDVIAELQGGRSTTRTVLAAIAALVAVVALGLWAANRPSGSDGPLLTGPSELIATGAGDEERPQISPDKKWVSFESNRDGPVKIVMRERSSLAERLIEPVGGVVMGHVWSPAGDQIAYVAPSGTPNQSILTTAPIGAGKTRSFTLPQSGVGITSWIRNGIYYVAKETLWRFDLDLGQSTEITTGRGSLGLRSADVSADERRIVFAAFKDGMSSIFYGEINGANPVRLTHTRMDPRFVQFRDTRAREVVYLSEEGGMIDIWQVDVTSAERQHLTMTDTREGSFDVSNDGTLLAYELVTEDSHLGKLNPADKTPEIKMLTSDRLSDLGPDASRTGGVIAFQRAKTLNMSLGISSASIQVSRDGLVSQSERLAEGYAPEVSPDGQWVASTVYKPDSRAVLWFTNVESRKSVFVSDKLIRISYTPFPVQRVATNMVWSPTETRLFFLAESATGHAEVWSASPWPDGTRVIVAQLTNIGADKGELRDLRLSADGTRLSYLLGSKAKDAIELHVLFLTRNEDRVIFREGSSVRLNCPGWTTDDSVVVIRTSVMTGKTDVVMVKDGQEKEVVLGLRDVNVGFALDPRRRTIYVTRQRGNVHSLHQLAIDTGVELPLYQGPPNGPSISGIRVLGDGRLLFAVQSQSRDIVANAIGR